MFKCLFSLLFAEKLERGLVLVKQFVFKSALLPSASVCQGNVHLLLQCMAGSTWSASKWRGGLWATKITWGGRESWPCWQWLHWPMWERHMPLPGVPQHTAPVKDSAGKETYLLQVEGSWGSKLVQEFPFYPIWIRTLNPDFSCLQGIPSPLPCWILCPGWACLQFV